MTGPLEPLHSDREKQRHPIKCRHSDMKYPSTLVAVQRHSGDWEFLPLHEKFAILCDQDDLRTFCRKVLDDER